MPHCAVSLRGRRHIQNRQTLEGGLGVGVVGMCARPAGSPGNDTDISLLPSAGCDGWHRALPALGAAVPCLSCLHAPLTVQSALGRADVLVVLADSGLCRPPSGIPRPERAKNEPWRVGTGYAALISPSAALSKPVAQPCRPYPYVFRPASATA